MKIFPIPREALEEIIAGVEMDLERSAYATFEDLYPYCYRVASAVGLCCIEIFGYTDVRAREYAVNLGVGDRQRDGVHAVVDVHVDCSVRIVTVRDDPALAAHHGVLLARAAR